MRGPSIFAIVSLGSVAALALTLTLVAVGRRSESARMRADVLAAIDRGGISDLDRARAVARRLVVADADDREAAGALAFVDAVLAVDYGFDIDGEIRAVLKGAGAAPGNAQAEARRPRAEPGAESVADMDPTLAAARALLLLRQGEREAAGRLATAISAVSPGIPHPLYALGRIRAANGETAAAERALQATVVGSPSFLPSRVAWAEARLDLGDAQAARTALQSVLNKTPGDLRARLLLDEAEQALGIAGTDTWQAACPAAHDRWPPPFVRAACALAQSSRARRAGARAEALARAEEAANIVPGVPRLQARVAQALAQLGVVDQAAGLLERARRRAAGGAPALAWAAVAVALGRGKAPLLPTGPRPADPEIRLLVARAALAAGGVAAVASALDGLGGAAVAHDVDLQLLTRLRGDKISVAPPATTGEDPVRAYVDGLRARLDGDLAGAVSSLRHALSGHGDACRAAGEYAAMLRVQKRAVDPASWNLLRAENAGCTNLH